MPYGAIEWTFFIRQPICFVRCTSLDIKVFRTIFVVGGVVGVVVLKQR